MFESVRTHRRWMMLFMLVLIFPSFVFFGIQGYNSFIGSDNALAKVDGSPITQQEFDQAQRDRIERLRQSIRARLRPEAARDPGSAGFDPRRHRDEPRAGQRGEQGEHHRHHRSPARSARDRAGVPGRRQVQLRQVQGLRRVAGPDGADLRAARARGPSQAGAAAGCRRVGHRSEDGGGPPRHHAARAARSARTALHGRAVPAQGEGDRRAGGRLLRAEPVALRDARVGQGRVPGPVAGNDRRHRRAARGRRSGPTTSRTRRATAPTSSAAPATS